MLFLTDIVMHSATKFIDGHGDIMVGVLAVNGESCSSHTTFLRLANMKNIDLLFSFLISCIPLQQSCELNCNWMAILINMLSSLNRLNLWHQKFLQDLLTCWLTDACLNWLSPVWKLISRTLIWTPKKEATEPFSLWSSVCLRFVILLNRNLVAFLGLFFPIHSHLSHKICVRGVIQILAIDHRHLLTCPLKLLRINTRSVATCPKEKYLTCIFVFADWQRNCISYKMPRVQA